MQKKINTIQLRDKLGEILDQIYYRGDNFIIERRGKSLAVIIPFEEYQKRQAYREQSFEVYKRMWEANRGYTSEEVEKDVADAIKAVREEMPTNKGYDI
ncbi:MAG: type II toxin-antitoxin system Phd/YefM family antitoxin [Actinobacteria bacterium]|nr:type II toxin-antitoxin system Phd/YefM family antitoxin [Actinomycetota bacterium]